MATSPKTFLIELYREYLEDASFLYDQRRALRADPQVSWRDLAPFDERLEACLDGLVVGGELAAEVCKKQLQDGDCGEAYAAVRVFCRLGLKAALLDTVQKWTLDEPKRLGAVADGLKQDCPEALLGDLAGMAANGGTAEAQLALVARVAGYRRWRRAAHVLASSLDKASPAVVPDLLSALGRTGSSETARAITPRLNDADEEIRASAAGALLALRDRVGVDSIARFVGTEPWASAIAAVAGGKPMFTALQNAVQAPNATPEAVLALGMCADGASVPLLMSLLNKGVHPVATTQALEVVLGAGLRETVFVPDPSGDVRPDGKPYGTTVTRLTLVPKRWEQWWSEFRPKYDPKLCYRLGQPYSPQAVLSTLEAPGSPAKIREWAADELRVRFGYDWNFDIDMPVSEQLASIATARSWVLGNASRFTPGRSYFAGQPVL
jgi:HEAT repeat protein